MTSPAARELAAGAEPVGLRRAAEALAVVLGLSAQDLRADSPLADLGADSIALVQWADVVEEQAAAAGAPIQVDDAALVAARTLGDLAAPAAGIGT